MKKKLIVTIIFILLSITINVGAATISVNDIPTRSYVIGTYLYTREPYNGVAFSDGYDGTLKTKYLMLGSTSIDSKDASDMIIYYKNPDGVLVNAVTDEKISNAPNSFDIKYVNNEVMLTKPILNYEIHHDYSIPYIVDGKTYIKYYFLILNRVDYLISNRGEIPTVFAADGFELYNASTNTLIGTYNFEARAEVAAILNSAIKVKARVFKYTTQNEKGIIYSDFSDVLTFDAKMISPIPNYTKKEITNGQQMYEVSIASDSRTFANYWNLYISTNSSTFDYEYDGIKYKLYKVDDKSNFDMNESVKFGLELNEKHYVITRAFNQEFNTYTDDSIREFEPVLEAPVVTATVSEYDKTDGDNYVYTFINYAANKYRFQEDGLDVFGADGLDVYLKVDKKTSSSVDFGNGLYGELICGDIGKSGTCHHKFAYGTKATIINRVYSKVSLTGVKKYGLTTLVELDNKIETPTIVPFVSEEDGKYFVNINYKKFNNDDTPIKSYWYSGGNYRLLVKGMEIYKVVNGVREASPIYTINDSSVESFKTEIKTNEKFSYAIRVFAFNEDDSNKEKIYSDFATIEHTLGVDIGVG